MPTLVLRNVPDELYARLKQAAATHHRSMNQEAIVALKAALQVDQPIIKPSWEITRQWLSDEVWSRPVLDERPIDEILDYDDHGLPR